MTNKEKFLLLVSDIETGTLAKMKERQTKRKSKMIWNYIKADTFFWEYLPHIKSYKHKIRGKNGRGNPTDFSLDEKKQIKQALRQMMKDILIP